MTQTAVRREHIGTVPEPGDGHLYARLALGPHRNLVYLLADPHERTAIVIDPAFELPRIQAVLNAWDARLVGAFFTHNHADHIEAAPRLAQGGVPLHIHRADAPALTARGLPVVPLEGQARFTFGTQTLIAHHTPGHTAGGLTYQVGRRLFTGDFLFIGQAGRTDFPSGSKRTMWDSLQRFKRTFPDDAILCPGHDYGDGPEATLGEEKRRNSALAHTDYEAFEKEWYLVAY